MMGNPLPQLLAEEYSPNTFPYICRSDLRKADAAEFPALEDWLKIFYISIESFVKIAQTDPSMPSEESKFKASAFAASYKSALDSLVESLDGLPSHQKVAAVNCLELCRLRCAKDFENFLFGEHALRNAGFQDPFLSIKTEENARALQLLPSVCAEIDAEEDSERRWELCIRGVCAANIFDLGAAHTSDMYHQNGGISFHNARAALLSRPWAIDDLNRIVSRFSTGPAYKKAILFVDNSGADVILGMLPLAREFLKQGTEVIVATNELPAINDITYSELEFLLPSISGTDDVLCKGISSGQLRAVSSGNDLPVIDLMNVSDDLVAAAQGADLVVLEGMGRSIETNLLAQFKCDALKIGMVKHPEVAAALNGRMLDCVAKFEENN